MANFSFKRYCDMIMLSLTANGRKLFMQICVLAAIIIGTMLLAVYTNIDCYEWSQSYGHNPATDPMWGRLLTLYMVLAAFTLIIAASNAMDWMGTRNQRINTLMVPATQLEKYAARFTIYIIGSTIVFNLLFILADFIRIGVTPLMCDTQWDGIHSILKIFNHVEDPDRTSHTISIFIASVIICLQALYLLGSTIWPKNSFIKTSMALTVIITVLTFFIWHMTNALFNYAVYSYPREAHGTANLTIFVVFTSLTTLYCWILGYFRFKESETIQRW